MSAPKRSAMFSKRPMHDARKSGISKRSLQVQNKPMNIIIYYCVTEYKKFTDRIWDSALQLTAELRCSFKEYAHLCVKIVKIPLPFSNYTSWRLESHSSIKMTNFNRLNEEQVWESTVFNYARQSRDLQRYKTMSLL